jgi:hypothetical protein
MANGSLRLGIGDYTLPHSDLASHAARIRFFEALDSYAPQVRASLRELLDHDGAHDLRIEAWARQHRLLWNGRPPRWIAQAARATLRAWAAKPEYAGWAFGAAVDWDLLPETDTQVTIVSTWNPSGPESEEEARVRLHAEVDRRLDMVERRACSEGGVKTRTKSEHAHFGWLACYVVNRESPEEIARKGRPHHVAATSVKKALRETATLLGLTLPQFPPTGKRGRPRKARANRISRQ